MDESDKTKVAIEEIPSLEKFVYPSKKMQKYVKDLEIYWQFSNQSGVKLYTKWQGKKYWITHTLKEFYEMLETKELFDLTTGDHWTFLISAIDYVRRYSDEVDMTGFNKMKREYQLEILDIISDGQTAYEKLVEWLEPINKKKCLEAIHDCIKIRIGNGRYDSFNILKLTKTKTIDDENYGIGLFPKVLEVETTEVIIDYFKYLKEPIPNSLIVVFLKDPKYKAPHIYLFLAYKNNFYVLNNDEQNLYQKFTTGIRQKDRYDYWYHFGHVWMPFHEILKKEKKSKSTAITIRQKKIIEQRPLIDIFRIHPEFKLWLEMFVYRVLDYFKKHGSEIPLGFTPENVVKRMLEDKTDTKELETTVKLKQVDNYEGEKEKLVEMGLSFSSHKDSATYLMEKYKSKMTSVVPSITKVPVMLATKRHIQNVIRFEQRKLVANQLQKLVNDDYIKNKKEVYKWFLNLIKKKGAEEMIRIALEDKTYSFDYVKETFADKKDKVVSVNGMRVTLQKNVKLQKKHVLVLHRYKEMPYHWDEKNNDIDIIMMKNRSYYIGGNYGNSSKRNNCVLCDNVQFSYLLELSFIDYRQILEFFNLEKESIPQHYIDHFHYTNVLNTDNHLSSDDDPVFTVKDPFFRRRTSHGSNLSINDNLDSNPEISVFYGICKRCFKRNAPKHVINSDDYRLDVK